MTKQPRPQKLSGQTYEGRTGCGNLYVVCNDRDGRLFEVFVRMGKSGTCGAAIMDAAGVVISKALRSGMDVQEIVKGWSGIECHRSPSCIDAVALAIAEHEAARVPMPEEGELVA